MHNLNLCRRDSKAMCNCHAFSEHQLDACPGLGSGWGPSNRAMSHTHEGLWVPIGQRVQDAAPRLHPPLRFGSESGGDYCQPYRLSDRPSDSPSLPPVSTHVLFPALFRDETGAPGRDALHWPRGFWRESPRTTSRQEDGGRA